MKTLPAVAKPTSITTSQMIPKVTCRPWVATNVKKAERKALRVGPLPWATSPANSWISRAMKPAPSIAAIPGPAKCQWSSSDDEVTPASARLR